MAPSNPNPKPPPPPPRTLNVKKFAESRARELESLHAVVSERLDHDFKIQRGKRRRTTGFRGPKRKKRKTSNSDPQPKVSRRVRRRLELRSNPDSGFVRSGDGTKRLRTHLWLAKRFAMVKRWGFYLPLGMQGRGRGSRAVLKWSKSTALLHDASYWHPVRLEGPEDSMLAILRMVLLPQSSISEEISCSVNSGLCYNNAMLCHVGNYPSQFIAPVLYMWLPANGSNYVNVERENGSVAICNSLGKECSASYRQLWIWIHAAALAEGLGALQIACQKQIHEDGALVSCFSLEGRIGKLEITGSKSTQILQKILHPVPDIFERRSMPDLKPSTLCEVDQLPSRAILSLTVNDPRDLPSKGTETSSEAAIDGCDLPQKDIPTSNPLVFGYPADSQNPFPAFLPKQESDDVCLSGCRHLWISSERLNPPVPENILSMDRCHKRLKYFYLDSINEVKAAQENRDNYDHICPILLLKHGNKGNSATGWSIVLPLSWVKAFWLSLVSHGAHAIGLRERRWIACDSGLPCFPHDFPDCKAYSLLKAAEAAEFNTSAMLRPPAVRPSMVPIPPPWDCLSSTCKSFGTQPRPAVLHPSSLVPCAQNSVSSLSEQSDPLNGFIPRYSNALSEYLGMTHGVGLKRTPSGSGLCLVRVLLHAYKEGVFEEGAVVCAPIPADLPFQRTGSEEEKMLQVPQSFIQSYFKQQDSGKWELLLPDSSGLEFYRWPIGFVTTGFVRGSKKAGAVAFCEVKLLSQLRGQQQSMSSVQKSQIFVLVRNLRSSAYRCALATIILDNEKEDTEFM